MNTEVILFHFEDDRESFEDIGHKNGGIHWLEADLRRALGYQSDDSFGKAINRAKQACLSIGIDCEDHIVRQSDGTYIFTRFGCYLVAMNGDTSKPQVAAAQAYFAALAETFQTHLEHARALDRVMIRDEVTQGQKSLASTAKSHGVTNYGFFMNKGYMGMYNMTLDKLMRYKNVQKGELLMDRMDKTELAAHLFRITQTDQKIRNQNIRGQEPLENAAYAVGVKVRETVMDISGAEPEDLPTAPHIKDVKRKLKGTNNKLTALDKPSKRERGTESGS